MTLRENAYCRTLDYRLPGDHFKTTGEFRRPKRGEFFTAVPEGGHVWYTLRDFPDVEYYIVVPT